MDDWYKRVPLDHDENLKYRESLLDQCSRESAHRVAMRKACREDILFFFAAFCWLFEPRIREYKGRRLPHIIPFTPWPHQEGPIRGIRADLGVKDVSIKKSRGEGASWIMILMALHDWLFQPYAQIGLVSSKEANVDIPNNLNTLFGKIDWELIQLPNWMSGNANVDFIRTYNKHTLFNKKNNANLTGYAATSDVGSGSRALWFGFDELSKFPRPDDEAAMVAVQQVTDSRLVVATPLGSSGAYYELIHEPSNMAKYELPWYGNPTRNRGLYRMKSGRPVAVDPKNNPLPAEYDPMTKESRDLFTRLRRKGYNLYNSVRSPWFDNECDRPRATPQSIAQELMMDFGGSQSNIFSESSLKAMADTITPELLRGNIGFHPETLKWDWKRADDGECYLWCPLDSKGIPPDGRYTASADIAVGDAGSYTSNSVLIVINVATREQVFEWASNSTSPVDFADFSIAVCRWFHGAHLAWEQNGPGGPYSSRILERGYQDIYRRVVLNKRSRRKTKEYGWWTDVRSKELLFADLIQVLKEKELVVRSKFIREEAIQYVRMNDLIVHGGHKLKGVRDGGQHGDRVIAIAVGVQAMKDMPMAVKPSKSKLSRDKDPPINSLAWRERYFNQQKRRRADGVDRRTLRDLMQ